MQRIYRLCKLTFIISLLFTIQSQGYADNLFAQSNQGNMVVKQKELVVLVHGLFRTTWSMYFIQHFLKKHGYETYSYGYPSTRYNIHHQSIALHEFIEKEIKTHRGIKIHFVTFSLGGIITREALTQLSDSELNNIGKVVMLAPPNHGSGLAKQVVKFIPFLPYLIKPLKELSSDKNSYVQTIPIPKVKIGIIGGRYDNAVLPESAKLDGQAEFRLVNSLHSFIMYNVEARKLTLSFLKTGTFQ